MYNSQQVADVIRTQTTLKKVGIKQMLKDIGLGVNTLSHLDNGSMPKADNLAKIADYLGCSVDYLLGRTDKPEGIAQINTGDVGDNSSVNISKTACNCDDELVSLINSLSLLERSKVVLFIDSLRQNENKG